MERVRGGRMRCLVTAPLPIRWGFSGRLTGFPSGAGREKLSAGMSRLLIVSNRLPITLTQKEGRLEVARSSGGLATGLAGPQ